MLRDRGSIMHCHGGKKQPGRKDVLPGILTGNSVCHFERSENPVLACSSEGLSFSPRAVLVTVPGTTNEQEIGSPYFSRDRNSII